jgi:hypothetical protein
MSFVDRASIFLVDRVAPLMVFGKGPRNQPSLADLEREAREELDARIRMGRPGPDEARSRSQAGPFRVRTSDVTPGARPVEVHVVALDALPGLPEPSGARFERLATGA